MGELVLFDTPPAQILGDSELVADHLDGIILLVSLGRLIVGCMPKRFSPTNQQVHLLWGKSPMARAGSGHETP